jgi:enamine deaminase RidA (YjgF/YER057c/UK114 family)
MPAEPSPLVPFSWRPDRPLLARDLAAALSELRQDLSRRDLAPVHLRLYAAAAVADHALATARDVWDGLVTVVVAPPCIGGEIGGAHGLATSPSLSRSPLVARGQQVGVRVGSDPEVLVLAGLTTPRSGDAEHEIGALFATAEDLLTEAGATFADVARTWLHLPHLLRDYDALNRARSAFFAPRGIGRTLPPPASTGIQGGSLDGARLQLDLIATAADTFRPMASTVQCEAWDYGSAFSRGMALGPSLVTVSGTASIGEDGDTLHLDDPAAQIRATWAAVQDLLQAEQLPIPLPGPQAWVLYFKDRSVWDAWRDLVARGEVVEPPDAVCLYADVCRSDLLFEMELTAGR